MRKSEILVNYHQAHIPIRNLRNDETDTTLRGISRQSWIVRRLGKGTDKVTRAEVFGPGTSYYELMGIYPRESEAAIHAIGILVEYNLQKN